MTVGVDELVEERRAGLARKAHVEPGEEHVGVGARDESRVCRDDPSDVDFEVLETRPELLLLLGRRRVRNAGVGRAVEALQLHDVVVEPGATEADREVPRHGALLLHDCADVGGVAHRVEPGFPRYIVSRT